MIPCITTRELIDANKKALATKRLGAFTHFSPERKRDSETELGYCLYRYADGCGCAVGVALPRSVIDKIKDTCLNHMSFGKLTYNKVVTFEDPPIVGITQHLHDSWLGYRHFNHDETMGAARLAGQDVVDFLVNLAHTTIDEEAFRAWIDFLDKKFPA